MRAAAVDFGKVRIGLAVGDELGLMAHPRPHLDGRDPLKVVRELASLAAAEGIGIFVVGLPRGLDGAEGPAARRARKFAQRLKLASGVKVVLRDEWLTTREAKGRLSAQGLSEREQRQRIDSAAAAVLLQSYLDGERERSP
ncbi:MAG TPA: Holliday junction resolvase RuvX [Polyangiaceae bacterium]|jgi:putative Holliday junction resolvase|nr:Holliday junction resolvase RuvX [Polyangiaceae bacterium]